MIRRALDIDPRRFLAHRDLGNLLLQSGISPRRWSVMDHALALKPGQAEILDNRGTALRMLGRLAEALESHDRALALTPGSVLAHINRGSALAGLTRFAEALESFDRAIALDGASALAHSNRGSALHRLERFAEALESHDRASRARARRLPISMSAVARRLPSWAATTRRWKAFNQALRLDPQSAEAQFGRATTLLVTGRFRKAGRPMKAAGGACSADAFHPQGRPQWSGREDIAGKILFIEGEQGLGDMIQFCRYARLCADKGAQVILTARESQVRLLESLDPRIEVGRKGPGQPLSIITSR